MFIYIYIYIAIYIYIYIYIYSKLITSDKLGSRLGASPELVLLAEGFFSDTHGSFPTELTSNWARFELGSSIPS